MSSSHWNDLAASLGAEVKEEQQAPTPQPIAAPVRAQKKLAEHKPAAPKSASNWAALADTLGIEVPPEAAKPAPAPSRPAPVREAAAEVPVPREARPPREEPVAEEAPPQRERGERKTEDRPARRDRGGRGERGRRDRGERGERTERDRGERAERPAREDSVAAESVEEFAAEYVQEDSVDMELSVPTESIDRATDEQEGDGRRRRRRRRGGRRSRRSRDGAESREPVEGAEDEARDEVFADLDARDDQPLVPPELDVDPLAGIDTFDDEDDEQGELTSEEGTASRQGDDESGERRGRRRRRRRRGRGRKESPEAAESEGESGDNVAGGWGSASTSAEDRVSDSDALEGDDEGDEEFVGASDKNSHRAIPTWDEAIGYIIAVNMDSRAKNPSRSGAPRGGRGRRGGRNGSRGGGSRSN